MNLSSVIAAVSTPPGKGGVAIIRISGAGALDIAKKVFVPKAKLEISELEARRAIFGNIVYCGEEIDDGILCYFKAPKSYTGEDTVEISCHGGALVTRTVLEAVFAAGAVPAEAGEFTKRALINGKISLTEAEAVGSLLEAKTHSQIILNSEKARGLLSEKIAQIRASLLDVLSSVFARIDYPDEDLGDFDNDEVITRLNSVKEMLEALIKSYKTGRAVNEGIDTVICGKPNVGKSSLYNLLLGEELAIVTDIEGTTRDVLTAEVSLGKALIRLSDTAGVRGDSLDKIELIGIERTREKINKSSLIFALFDSSSTISSEDAEIIKAIKGSTGVKIAVLNKCDKPQKFEKEKLRGVFSETLEVSVKEDPIKTRLAIAELVDKYFTDEKISLGNSAVVANARQNAELIRALDFVNSAKEALELGFSQDLASSDIERALGEIAELDGKAVSDEVLNDIFSKFCVGK